MSSSLENTSFQKFIADFEPSQNFNDNMFALSRLLRGKKSQIPPLVVQQKVMLTDHEKAEIFATTFHYNHLLTLSYQFLHDIEEAVRESEIQINMDTPINVGERTFASPKEIRNIVKRVRSNKAPGDDGIQLVALKNARRKCITALTYIINACLVLSYFPQSWKTAVTIPVRKPGKLSSDVK